MAANNSTTAASFINPPPPPPLLFYAPPPPVMVPSPFGVYYTFPTYTYYTHQYQPLFTNPRPAFPVVHHQSATATATDYPQNQYARPPPLPPQHPPLMIPLSPMGMYNAFPQYRRYTHHPPIFTDSVVPTATATATDYPTSSETRTVPRTTLMIHNVPKTLGRVHLLNFLDRCCQPYPDLEYDFLHLPFDSWKGCHKGYAFVNLTTTDGANKLMEILQGYKWEGNYDEVFISNRNLCKITWLSDNQQGKEAQIRIFEASKFKCVDDELSPLIFDPPRNGSHPNPTPPFPLCRNY